MHPENSTTPPNAQPPLVTEAVDFRTAEGESRSPFSVNAGLPVGEALNLAMCLLGAVDHLATCSIDHGPRSHDAVAMRFIAAAAGSLIHASITSIESVEALGGAQ